MAEKIRLQKMLADCGVASRRKAEELIAAGRVRVNGRPAVIGEKVDPKADKVTVYGKRVIVQRQKIYIMLNKPRGFVTTMQDEQGRKCVAELVKNAPVRVFPVGRLDLNSEGLLLMTNDGDFANGVMHPSKHVPKTYRVTVSGKVSDDHITSLSAGLMLDERITAPADVRIVAIKEDRTAMEITLYEGRNRQIRRMCEEIGLEVMRLKRIAVGNVKLGMLKTGDWRELNEKELRSIKTLISSQ